MSQVEFKQTEDRSTANLAEKQSKILHDKTLFHKAHERFMEKKQGLTRNQNNLQKSNKAQQASKDIIPKTYNFNFTDAIVEDTPSTIDLYKKLEARRENTGTKPYKKFKYY